MNTSLEKIKENKNKTNIRVHELLGVGIIKPDYKMSSQKDQHLFNKVVETYTSCPTSEIIAIIAFLDSDIALIPGTFIGSIDEYLSQKTRS